jgi:two-component system, cell cycle sensor histidine kinase and response regulator CckA
VTHRTAILIVEDEFVVSHDLAISLTDLGYAVCAQVDSGAEAIQKAGQLKPDMVLMDIRLKGDMDGIQAAACIHQLYRMPIIFLTAHADQNLLKRAKIAEPFGYLLKPFSKADLYTAIEVGLYKSRLETRLRRSEDRFKQMADQLPTGICEMDREYRIQFINRAGLEILGLSPEDLHRGIDLRSHLKPGDAPDHDNPFQEALLGLDSGPTEHILLKKDGSSITVIIRCVPIHEESKIIGARSTLTDITQLKHLQNRLNQIHRLETVGTLSGGIAHEFNNALTIITTGIELLRMSTRRTGKEQKFLTNMQAATDRMTQQVRMLMAYARQGQWQIEAKPLSQFAQSALDQTGSIFGRSIRVITDLRQDTPAVALDEAQFRIIMSALLTNAVEAIEGEGFIRITTGDTHLKAEDIQDQPGLAPCHYACLKVEDNGRGMEETERRRIFEPFFSTKFQGRGLGMASVYGIVKNHGGWIGVESRPGEGTTVTLYFPVQAPNGVH